MEPASNKMSPEEKAEFLMSIGHFIDIELKIWTGSVYVSPGDLNLGTNALPVGHQTIQVMSRSWINRINHVKETAKKGSWQYSYLLTFGDKRRRYVFTSALPVVIKNLDKHGSKVRVHYKEAADKYKETCAVARQIISKNAIYIWRAVSHLVKPRPLDPTVVPDLWKVTLMDRVMHMRFPSEDKLRKSGLYYTITKPDTTGVPTYGKFQKQAAHTVGDTSAIAEDLLKFVPFMEARLQLRIIGLTKGEFDTKCIRSIYHVHLTLLQRDLEIWPVSNPVPVEGFGMQEALAELSQMISPLTRRSVRDDQTLRFSIATKVLGIIKIMHGPWAAKREETYRNLFE